MAAIVNQSGLWHLNRPRIGVALWKVGDWDLSGFEAAAEVGLDHVQIDLGGPNRGPDLTNAKVLAAVTDASRLFTMPIVGLTINRLNDLGLTSPEGSQEASEVRQSILCAIKVASELRVPQIVIPGFRRSIIQSSEDMKRTAEVLRFAIDLAQIKGIDLAYESQLDADGTLQILQMVGRQNLSIQFDIGNPAMHGQSAATMWPRLAAFAASDVHVKDVSSESLAGEDVPLGKGQAALEVTFEAFAHYVWPESFTLEGNYKNDSVYRIRRDLAYLKTLIATYQ